MAHKSCLSPINIGLFFVHAIQSMGFDFKHGHLLVFTWVKCFTMKNKIRLLLCLVRLQNYLSTFYGKSPIHVNALTFSCTCFPPFNHNLWISSRYFAAYNLYSQRHTTAFFMVLRLKKCKHLSWPLENSIKTAKKSGIDSSKKTTW